MVADNGTPQFNRRRELTENVGARSVVLIRRTNINEVCGGSTTLVQLTADEKPLITIKSGGEITFDNTNADFCTITPTTKDADLQALNLKDLTDIERCTGPIYVDGPVFVEGAEPGDTLKVEILALETGDWGWTAVFPGLGLLQDEFPGPNVKTFSLSPAGAVFKEGKVVIPAAPFYGTMGVAPPPSAGACHPLFPRNDMGGNFDCRALGIGSTLYLRVNVRGALFSVGDAHFSQGDGEITGTALETTMRSRFRLSVLKADELQGLVLESPHYETIPKLTAEVYPVHDHGEHGVMATASTREEAIKTAVLEMCMWRRSVGGNDGLHKLSRPQPFEFGLLATSSDSVITIQ